MNKRNNRISVHKHVVDAHHRSHAGRGGAPIRHSGAAAPATAGVAPYLQLLLPNLLCVALFLDSSIRTESEGTCSEG